MLKGYPLIELIGFLWKSYRRIDEHWIWLKAILRHCSLRTMWPTEMLATSNMAASAMLLAVSFPRAPLRDNSSSTTWTDVEIWRPKHWQDHKTSIVAGGKWMRLPTSRGLHVCTPPGWWSRHCRCRACWTKLQRNFVSVLPAANHWQAGDHVICVKTHISASPSWRSHAGPQSCAAKGGGNGTWPPGTPQSQSPPPCPRCSDGSSWQKEPVLTFCYPTLWSQPVKSSDTVHTIPFVKEGLDYLRADWITC